MFSSQQIVCFIPLFAFLESAAAVTYGRPVAFEKYPFVASLQWKEKHKCGGVLISPDTILTVASCYAMVRENPKENYVSVLLGTAYQYSEPNDPPQPYKIRAYVRQFIWPPGIPEKFKTLKGMRSVKLKHMKNDYLILKLHQNITNLVFPPLKDCRGNNRPQPNDRCIFAGWGRHLYPDVGGYRELFPRQFRRGYMRIQKDNVSGCEVGEYVAPSMMCVRQSIYKDYPMGLPCFGDEGGPLMCQNSCKQLYLAGLFVAAKLHCGRIHGLGVFMRISSMQKWIERNM